MMKTIGLCMIVKNEAALIRRCLDSVRPLIDYVLIEDTGSTDGTQDIIREYLQTQELLGEVIEETWQDFASNRSSALARLRDRVEVDYALIMDADDVLVLDNGFDVEEFKKSLSADLYSVTIRLGGIVYDRPQICSNRLGFYYRGVLHEFFETPRHEISRGFARGFYIQAGVEGGRSQDPDKYRKDAETLERVLETEQDAFMRSRYTFYLAQSWHDCGEKEKALPRYLERATMGFWDEEVYYSVYRAGQLQEALGHPEFEVIGTYLRAFQICPRRAEALHDAARFCRIKGLNHLGYMIAKHGLSLPQPDNALFGSPWVYDYALLDEFSINAYWCGRYDESLEACEKLLRERKIPNSYYSNIERNANAAREKLKTDGTRISAETPVGRGPSLTNSPGILPSTETDDATATLPLVLVAILAKQKERVLPFYLTCIDALDYPKDRIVLYVRTFNSTDQTATILTNWLDRVRDQYGHVVFDDSDTAEPSDGPGHSMAMGEIRQRSLTFALDTGCDYYAVINLDNFIKPHTLKTLVQANKPIIAPLLRHDNMTSLYSNYHEKVDANGYFKPSEEYGLILSQKIKGLFEVSAVHGTYVVRRDVIPNLYYIDGSGRYEYAIFSESARRAGIPQYLDNRDIYGYLSPAERTGPSIRQIGGRVIAAARKADIVCTRARKSQHPRNSKEPSAPIFIHSSWRTASTWFWSKFRQLPSTLAFYEPFSLFLNGITREQSLLHDINFPAMRHPDTDPYNAEYFPLIRRSGGVRFFSGDLPFQTFFPSGGLHGPLRQKEQRYLALLLHEAKLRGRVPVLGFCRSLGRIAAIKQAFGGLNIFLFRNLWMQWSSYLEFKQRGDNFFYISIPLLMNRTDDKFTTEISSKYLERAGKDSPVVLEGVLGTDAGERILSSLSEADMFALFMAHHIYLYLHAERTADLIVDASNLASNEDYRCELEDYLTAATGLPLSLSDAKDGGVSAIMPDPSAIDWQAIREHAELAARTLGNTHDAGRLSQRAAEFVDDTYKMATGDVPSPRPSVRIRSAAASPIIGSSTFASQPMFSVAGFSLTARRRPKTFKSCPACGATITSKPRADLEPHPYVRCEACGLFYQPYMEQKIFQGHHEARGDLMSDPDRAANRSLATAIYHRHLLPRLGNETLFHLDIGSKYPYFGHCLQNIAAENGKQLISYGIDSIPEGREFGRQLGVMMGVGDFEADPNSWDMPAPMREKIAQGSIHFITLIHCFEYFYEPVQVLRHIHRLMAPGGILFIRSPDSQAPGIEQDFTSGHYGIHPTIWCESAMQKALSQLDDAFAIYDTYPLFHQRDYFLEALSPRQTSHAGRAAPATAEEKHKSAPAIINLLRPGAIGDVLATGAVTWQLASRYPNASIRYYTKINEMAGLLVGVDKVIDADQWGQREPGLDLSLIGYPIAEGYPERPMQRHLMAYFCEEANVPFGLPKLQELQPFDIEQDSWITIHPKAGWSVYKDWEIDNWNEIIRRIHEAYPGIAVVQIGSRDHPLLSNVDHDLRGRTSISQALWLVKNSKLHLGVDSFTNHAAGAFGHPAVIVFGSTNPTGFGYDTATNLWAGLSCSPCYREDPRISRQPRGPCINPPGQEYAQPRHACMAAISVERVWEAISSRISKLVAPLADNSHGNGDRLPEQQKIDDSTDTSHLACATPQIITNPYEDFPAKAFWRTAVADKQPLEIERLWTPKFPISKDIPIVTAGSCFAQHIGRALVRNGYYWYDSEPAHPNLAEEVARRFNYGIFSFRTGNIYTTALLLQWLNWAFDRAAQSKEYWSESGRFHDPFRPHIEPEGFASSNELFHSRNTTLRAIRRAIESARLFVFTLGLTEAWLNTDGSVYPMCPGTIAGRFDPQRHIFHNYGYIEIRQQLMNAMDLIRSLSPDMKFLLTVSPVPLTATASDDHVLVATSYSKSVLRAVAGDLASARSDTDYFPSYEIISSFPFKGMFYNANLRTVSQRGVDFVMQSFFAALSTQNRIPQVELGVPQPPLRQVPQSPVEDLVCEDLVLEAFRPAAS